MKITEAVARDTRFPTSEDLSGSDAMNEASDYSATYEVHKIDVDLLRQIIALILLDSARCFGLNTESWETKK